MTRDQLLIFGECDGQMTLTISDYELFDFIDDFLAEQCDFDRYSSTVRNDGGADVFVLNFWETLDWQKVKGWVLGIDPSEIERIWRVNNPK